MRGVVLAAGALLIAGCNPVVMGELVAVAAANPKETENFELRNEVDDFYIQADHHEYRAVETYEWENRGPAAMIEGAARPSCPNDVTIEIRDAGNTPVFLNTYHAPHCWKDKPEHWDPILTSEGKPGTWRITMIYDITGVKEMWFHVWRIGDPPVEEPPCEGGEAEWGVDHVCGLDVEEVLELPVCCPTAGVDLACDGIEEGSLDITIRDAHGESVYHRRLEPCGEFPPHETTAEGAPGPWTVTLKATHFSASKVSVCIKG